MGSVKYRLQNVKSQYQNADWKVLTTVLLELGAYDPELLKYQGFSCISYILKELYCITEAPLDVLKFEL